LGTLQNDDSKHVGYVNVTIPKLIADKQKVKKNLVANIIQKLTVWGGASFVVIIDPNIYLLRDFLD